MVGLASESGSGITHRAEGEAEPAEELGEVGVDHGLVVLAEPAAGLAGGKAEDGGAEQGPPRAW